MTTNHSIGATVRVRDDARSRHAGETGTVVKRIDIDIPGEPYPVLVRFPYGSTALYADSDLEAVDAVPHGLLLDVEPGPPAPRCPHCDALEARVAAITEMADTFIAYLYTTDGEHRWGYGPASYALEPLAAVLHPERLDGDLTDAPAGTEVGL